MFTIVCLGDSITCNWDSPTYVDYWQALLNQKYSPKKIQVISAGVNGETAQDGYHRLNHDVLAYQPDLVTIMFGHNEVYLNVDPKIYLRYLANLIQSLHHAGVRTVWLLSPNRIGDASKESAYAPYLEKLPFISHENQVEFIDLWSQAFLNKDLTQIYTFSFDYEGLSGIDYLHPNPLGHQLIAKYLMDQYVKIIKS